MGLLWHIAEFFSGGKKKVQMVSLEEAGKLVDEELAAQEKGLVEFASAKFAEIKHLVSRLSSSASLLESQKIDLKEGNEAFRRIVSTSQKNLSRQLKGLSQKLGPPTSITPQSVREYCSKAMPAIANDLMPYWKNIALAKLLLKDEIREIGGNLKELAGAIESLQRKSFDERARKLASLKSIAMAIHEKEKGVAELRSRVAEAKKEHSAALLSVSSLEASLAAKGGSPEASRLAELETETADLESKKAEIVSRLNSSLAPLEKVLKRLHAIAESGGALSAREREVLALLLKKPEAVIISDPKGEAMKGVLAKAAELVHNGSISLKDAERKKRLGAIAALLAKDFFSEYFWEMNRVQAQLLQCQKEAAGLTITPEISSIEAKLESAREAATLIGKDVEMLDREFAVSALALERLRGDCVAGFNSLFAGAYEISGEGHW